MQIYNPISYSLMLFVLCLNINACTLNTSGQSEPLTPIEVDVITTLDPEVKRRLIDDPHAKRDVLWAFDRTKKNDIVPPKDIELLAKRHKSIMRGRMIGNLLELDLDGDNQVSMSELNVIPDGVVSKWLHEWDRNLPYSVADKNKDGYISVTEMQKFARIYAKDRKLSKNDRLELYLMAFDTDQNNILTREELENYFDDHLTQENSQTASIPGSLRSKDMELNELDQPCRPAVFPDQSDPIILVSTYGGSAYSSVAVSNLDDVTEIARLKIEPGTTPIYIVASSLISIIWSIEGDTDRVAGFVSTMGRWDNTGVVGLDENIIQFIPHECVDKYGSSPDISAIKTQRRFERIFDREVLAGSEQAQTYISFPRTKGAADSESDSLKKAAIKNGNSYITADNGIKFSIRNNSNSMLYRFKPDGLAIMPIDKVISPQPVNEYEVYPAEAGIMQLLNSGHLKPGNGAYYIRKTFSRYPPSLGGGHSVNFILGKGVKNPDGNPGHSKVISEETGLCLSVVC